MRRQQITAYRLRTHVISGGHQTEVPVYLFKEVGWVAFGPLPAFQRKPLGWYPRRFLEETKKPKLQPQPLFPVQQAELLQFPGPEAL